MTGDDPRPEPPPIGEEGPSGSFHAGSGPEPVKKRAAMPLGPFVPVPACPCGKALDFCGTCGELACFATGHAHRCEGVSGAA